MNRHRTRAASEVAAEAGAAAGVVEGAITASGLQGDLYVFSVCRRGTETVNVNTGLGTLQGERI